MTISLHVLTFFSPSCLGFASPFVYTARNVSRRTYHSTRAASAAERNRKERKRTTIHQNEILQLDWDLRDEGDRWPMHPLLWHQSRRHVVHRQRRPLRDATATQHECTDGSDVLLSSPGGTARAEAGSPSSKVTRTSNAGTSFLRKSFRGNANVLSNVSGSLFSKSLVFVSFFRWSLLALLCGTVFLWVLSTGANCRS